MKAQPEGKRVPVGTVRQGAAGRRANKWNGSKWVPVPVPGGASRSDAKQAASKPKRTASASAAAAANRSGVAKKAGAIGSTESRSARPKSVPKSAALSNVGNVNGRNIAGARYRAAAAAASAASRKAAKSKAKALGGKKKGL